MTLLSRTPWSLAPPAACMLASLGLCGAAAAQEEDLQKKLSNPVADIVTVPFEETTTVRVGPLRKPAHVLNVEPVYPVRLGTTGWTLINRLIVPLVSQPAFAPGQDRATGLGDIVYEGFFSPPPSGGVQWGIGPIVQARTATDDRTGTGKWAAGPAFVGVVERGPWTVGALVTQLWSFAGASDRPQVDVLQFQPIAAWRLDKARTLSLTGTWTYEWKQAAGERWTVPIGLSYSLLTRPPGSVPVNYKAGLGYNVVRPDHAGTWFLRLQVTFILPK